MATAVAALIPLAAAAPGGAAGDRQTVSLNLTTTVPGAPSGNRFSIQWHNPADPSAKPPAVDRMIFHLARGTRYDFSALPQCKASDAEMMVRGTAGCPAETWVSNGRVVTDTGSPGVFPRFINVRTTMFNNQNEMVGVGESEELPFRTVTRTKYQGERVTIDMPDNPGGPPDNRTAFKSLETVMSPIVRNGRSYARTPSTCPVSGFWTFRSEFIYHDGVRQIETTRAPCRRSANPCLASRSGISRRGIARIRLGRSRGQLRSLPVRPPRAGRRILSWCVTRSRGRVRALFDRRGKAVLALTTAGGHGNRGVRPGRSARRLRSAYPNRRRLARGVYRAWPQSRMVIGVRGGRVRYVAVATRRLVGERRALMRALRRARR